MMRTIKFKLTDAMAAEVDRIKASANIDSDEEVFRRAFTLLRIHVAAAQESKTVMIGDCPRFDDDIQFVTLPFNVRKE